MGKARQTASKAAEVVAGAGVFGRFAGPWLGGALLGPGVGEWLHDNATSPARATWMTAILVLGTITIMIAVTIEARTSSYGSDMAKYFLTARAVITAFGAGVGLLITMAVGWYGSPDWRLVCYLLGGIICLMWNTGRLAIFREGLAREGGAAGTAAGMLEKVKTQRIKVITATPERTEVHATLAPGTTLKDVQDALPVMSQSLDKRVIAGGASVVTRDYEGDVKIGFLHKQPLKGTLHWPGPQFPGGSVMAGFQLADYIDGEPVIVKPWGDYDAEETVGHGHIAVGGMPGAGKGECVHCFIGEYISRRDASPILLADTRKADQFAGPVKSAIGWHAQTEPLVKQMLLAIERSAKARTAVMGKAGFKRWTPEVFDVLGIPASLACFEEMAAYADDFARILVELGEYLRSTGWLICGSQQRWTSDRVSTSFRSSFGNALVFGTDNDDSADCLAHGPVAAGVSPADWKNAHPGRLLAVVAGVTPERHATIAKAYLPERLITQVCDEYGPQRKFWEGDIEAFGAPYQEALARAAAEREAGAAQLASIPSREVIEVAAAEMFAPPAHEDDDDEPEYEPTPKEESEYAVSPNPESDADDRSIMARVDPYAPPPAAEWPEVNLSAPLEPNERMLSRPEKERAFERALLSLLDSYPGRKEFSTAEIREAYAGLVGDANAEAGDAFMFEMVTAKIDAGQLERQKRGRYVFHMLADAHRK